MEHKKAIIIDFLQTGGYDLEATFGEERKTALVFDAEWARGGHVARELLRAGALPLSILGARVINPVALSALDEFSSRFVRVCLKQSHFWNKITLPYVRHNRDAFLLAKIVKKHGPIPQSFAASLVEQALMQQSRPEECVNSPHADQVLAAFFCFSVVNLELPMLDVVLANIPHDHREQYFCWRFWSHRYCTREIQKQVVAAFMVLHRHFPAEVMEKILSRATTDHAVEMIE